MDKPKEAPLWKGCVCVRRGLFWQPARRAPAKRGWGLEKGAPSPPHIYSPHQRKANSMKQRFLGSAKWEGGRQKAKKINHVKVVNGSSTIM